MNANVMFRFVLLYSVPASELAEAVAWANGALVTGALTALPVHLFPLDDIAAAQDAVEHGAVGKVLVVPDRHI
jgi:NADPH2:quinone reductase